MPVPPNFVGDLPGWIIAVAALVGPVATALILYGGQTARMRAMGERLTKVESRQETTSSVAEIAAAGLTHHQNECEHRADDTRRRLERIERMVENLAAQFNNIATGRAGRFFEVRTGPLREDED